MMEGVLEEGVLRRYGIWKDERDVYGPRAVRKCF